MAVPAGAGVAASGRSPYYPHDQANSVVQGTLSGVGPTAPFMFWGPMNLLMWGEYTTTLNTTASSLAATITSAGTTPAAVLAGQGINSTLVPPGTTVGAITGTDVTLALPPRTVWGFVTVGKATVTGLASTAWLAGATVVSDYFPAGTVVATITTPAILATAAGIQAQEGTVTLDHAATSMPPNHTEKVPVLFVLAAAAIGTGSDAAAVFTGAAIGLTGTVQLERSFDGGSTWIVCNSGGTGMLAQFDSTTPVSATFGDPERQMLYRLNTTAQTTHTDTALKYRISTTGQAAITLSVPTI